MAEVKSTKQWLNENNIQMSDLSPHPSLAVGDRVVDLKRPDLVLTVRGYIPGHGVLLLISDSGTPMICPAKWYERLTRKET